ncbi:M48 family metalloprotease [Verrucomicrobiaceae bacterium 5K15]|uniref:M48 family metalloprotease n=1 Tax=Oceaniferula flava TaxID=2800421 RepID=A0AAE2VBW2_9BACT|nr:M56 family metallopeptidase [Oceaniferula flavus]MBK1854336.1 M48 family metalloprotease [Oceaniferula flavus]MBM1135642.1 M48 family metalloprotease [Oceaniferula flavus]
MEPIYSWLVQAALGIIIPALLVLGVLVVSKGNSASARSAILWGAALLLIVAPLLRSSFPVFHWTIPALDGLHAFSEENEVLNEALQKDAAFRKLEAPPAVATNEQEDVGLPIGVIVVFWIWLGGVLVSIGRHLWLYFKSLQILTAARIPEGEGGLQAINLSAEKLNITPAPVVLVSEKCHAPFAGGLIRPVVVIPERLLSGSREALEMVLVHEFAHLRRRDVVRQLPMIWLQVVFWFHPLIWFLSRRGYVETEKACDDAVILAGYSAVDYSELLVAMSPGRDRFLQERLLALTSVDRWRTPLGARLRWLVVGGTFTVLLFTALIQLTPWPEDQPIIPVRVDGLVAHWKFERGRGTIVADWSGHECHGRIQGAKWDSDPDKGEVLRFDGRDDYVLFRAPGMDFSRDDFTVSLWLKLDADSDGGGLIMKGDRNGVWNGGSQRFAGKYVKYGEQALLLSGNEGIPLHPSPGYFPSFASYGNAFVQASEAVPTGEWVNLTFFCRHDTLADGERGPKAWFRVYLNGEKVSDYRGVNGGTNHIHMKSLDWVTDVWYVGVGEAYVVKDNHFEGLLHQLSVFNRALTAKEIKAFYAHGVESLKTGN